MPWLFLIVIISVDICAVDSAYFYFPSYHYNKKGGNERRYRAEEDRCRPTCRNTDNLEEIKCIRLCVNPKCYNEIYGFNELEDGEIDIRYSSFKGCTVKALRQNF